MNKLIVLPALLLAVASGQAAADQRGNAVAGALIGSAAGAAIGHHFSGRDGAIVGGALGAATGVAVATSGRESARRDSDDGRDAYIYGDRDDRYVRERVVYVQPEVRERVVYVERDPVVIYRPSPVVYRSAPVIVQRGRQVVRYDRPDWEPRGKGHGHGHGHDRGKHNGWKHSRHGHDD